MNNFLRLVLCWLFIFLSPGVQSQVPLTQVKLLVPNQWIALRTIDEGGLLGDRVDLWRNNRLWYVANSGFLISGFESRPGTHRWQGEHIGKWLHAATLAYNTTGDEKVKKELDRTVERLIASQLPNGYLGTYAEDQRFYNLPADSLNWDIWTDRYNLYGLLAYEKYNPNEKVVEACKREADLLISTYGNGKADITRYGTRFGMSSTTILESIVLLYERTGDKKYLEFAEEIVRRSENNPGLSLMSSMLKKESVVEPGDGKAYQLMANLLGYLRLYQNTGNEKYLQTVLNAWESIRNDHILITGGPWTRKTFPKSNKECFAGTEYFNPSEIVVENCSSVTWIQLNTQLLELTGNAKYAEEAEKTFFNQLIAGQHDGGTNWCYYTKPNEFAPPFVPIIHCCASSGPRALEIFAGHLVGQNGNVLSINNFSSSTIALNEKFGKGNLTVKSSFPFNSAADMLFSNDQPKSFVVEFRIPYGSSLKSVMVNGKTLSVKNNSRGYFQLERIWKKGDLLSVNLDYKLQQHIQKGEKNKTWIAFSYGPVVLAQKIVENPSAEPLKDLTAGSAMKLIKSKEDGSSVSFTIPNTGIELVPYYQTASAGSGPRTYFEIRGK